jgi:hypothetical protein
MVVKHQGTQQITMYTIAVIGQKGVRKSSFLNRHISGEFKSSSDKVFTWTFMTSYGDLAVSFHLFESVEECTITPDCYLLMFDLHNLNTLYALDISKLNKPYVVTGNKSDIKMSEKKFHSVMLEICAWKSQCSPLAVWLISGKSCFNFEQPFLSLFRVCPVPRPTLCLVAPIQN